MIILIGGEKGGTGKTTLATNLAALRALAGRDVLLVDTDPQGSASYWAQCRDEENIKPRVACIQKFGKGLQNEAQDLAHRYEDIIIDAGGRDSVELRVALVVAERAYVPIQASQFDIWTLGRMDDLVNTAQGFNPDLMTWVVISRASTNPAVTEVSEARGILSDFEHLSLTKSIIRDRIAYRKAARDGLCTSEMKPEDQKASQEINALYMEIFGDDEQTKKQATSS
jgi:chromosome partitioning protein